MRINSALFIGCINFGTYCILLDCNTVMCSRIIQRVEIQTGISLSVPHRSLFLVDNCVLCVEFLCYAERQ